VNVNQVQSKVNVETGKTKKKREYYVRDFFGGWVGEGLKGVGVGAVK